ncbi:MAG TPA: lysophospholipid acyltransferase family protein [Gemmatimonadaceae bacterium]|nr:lysophospholipid acyltransferase family protein [Gemmatimonadaceae bacterium]
MYALLRAVAGLALHWYYRRVDVEGADRIPRRGPLLLAVNHPNALVDALLVGWSIPRRIVITAKATLFQHALLAWFLRHVGVVPLIRASDLPPGAASDRTQPSRNAQSFRALLDVLRRGGAILIFPEGKSHDEPALAPLRTGTARIALEARDGAGVQGLSIVPVGLTFERKEAPRSRVLVQVAQPIALNDWIAPNGENAPQALTDELDVRLRAVTVNYATSDDAARATALASLFTGLFRPPAPLDPAGRSLHEQVSIARRIQESRQRLASATPALRERADHLLHRLEEFEQKLRARDITADDLEISTSWRAGVRFLARLAGMLVVAGPLALWGQINHWIPFHAARAIAMRSVESASDPAMRTILTGCALVLGFYAIQGAAVAAAFGGVAAAVYLATLPLAAQVMLRWRDHAARARRRARTFLVLRRHPGMAERLRDEMRWLRAEALTIDAALRALSASEPADMGRPDPSARPFAAHPYEDPSAA